jgi:hypothetical protein
VDDEPIISRGVLKAALVLLVAAGLGAGAYVVASGDIDLPDIDLETTGDVTSLEDTTLQDTTIEGPKPERPVKPTPIPDTFPEAQKLNDCVKRAGGSTDEILACFEQFQ